MLRALTVSGIVCFAFGCVAATGCAGGVKTSQMAQTPTGMHEIIALYEKATEHHRRAIRKPVREARARAMRMLSAKAGQLFAETEAWSTDVRLTSIDASERDSVRSDVIAFREALQGLENAAGRASISAVRTNYATAMASYRRLGAITGTTD